MAEGFNLARRMSARNEPDLLQEDFASDDDKTWSSPFTQQYCITLIPKVCPSSPLPRECQQYPEVGVALKRHNTDKAAHEVAFSGMSPGERAAAMVAREHGRLSQAQIKRRLTSSHDKHSSWFG